MVVETEVIELSVAPLARAFRTCSNRSAHGLKRCRYIYQIRRRGISPVELDVLDISPMAQYAQVGFAPYCPCMKVGYSIECIYHVIALASSRRRGRRYS